MKFIFTAEEKKSLHEVLKVFTDIAPGRDRTMRRHALRIAKKFSPNTTYVDLSPLETTQVAYIAMQGIKRLNEQLSEVVIDPGAKEKARRCVENFTSIATKLGKGLA